MTKLTRLRRVGRYRNTQTGQEVNLHKGLKVGYGCDVLFYYQSGSRVFLSDWEVSNEWERVEGLVK